MREFSLPPLVETVRSGGLADSVYDMAERNPELVLLSRRWEDEEGTVQWVPVTAAAFRDEVLALAKGLLADGVRFGDRIAVMARTRYEWTLFSYALWSVGAQLIPVYPTSSAEQVQWILASTQTAAIVVEHEDHAMTIGAVCDGLPRLRRIWQLDEGCVARLAEQGRAVPGAAVDQCRAAVNPHTAATITYTSGTTGQPKGCVITHANLAYDSDTLVTGWRGILAPPGRAPSVLAFLPLSHVYGLMVQISCVRHGIRLGHQPDISTDALLPALASFRPTFLYAVPYVFEKIFHKARRLAEEVGRLEVFDRAVEVAVRHAEAVERRSMGLGPGPGATLRLQHTLYDRAVYAKLRAVLGGEARWAVSGGSPLSRELGLAFAGAGITVHDGYGLTETSAAATAQPPGQVRYGTVGRPLPGSSVHIGEDGEVWVRGPHVFAGYLDDRKSTEAVLRDGWFATGDIGFLDSEGYLTITGRKKDIIITSGGKSLSPVVLEERLRAHPLIAQCLVVGDNRPFVAALVTLDQEALAHWQQILRKEPLGPREAMTDVDLREEIQRGVSRANTAVSRAESVRAFRILPNEFSVADGTLTPSLKLRRAAIAKVYASVIEEIYAR